MSKSENDASKESEPPSSDSEPISLREMELEPVSLHDIERILAPGKAPPKLSDAARTKPDKQTLEPQPKASVPRAGERRLPKPAPKPAPAPAGRAQTKVEEEADDDRAPDSAIQDLRRLASATQPGADRDSKVDEMLVLGGIGGAPPPPLLPTDLATLLKDTKDDPEASPKPRPKPPLKKRAEPVTEVLDLKAPSSTPPKRDSARPTERESTKPQARESAKPRASESSRPRTDSAAAVAKSIKPRASSRAPAARSSDRPAVAPMIATDRRPGNGSTLFYAAIGLGLLGAGYWWGTRGEPPAPTAGVPAPTVTVVVTQQVPVEAAPIETAPLAATPDTTAEPTPTTTPAGTGASAGAKPQATTTNAATATAAPTTLPTAAPVKTSTAAATADFDKAAASAALGGAVAKAAACKKAGDPSGQAKVQVTFAPSGRVTVANILGPPFAGTATGSCIAMAFKSASVPPFQGDPMTVSKTVSIP